MFCHTVNTVTTLPDCHCTAGHLVSAHLPCLHPLTLALFVAAVLGVGGGGVLVGGLPGMPAGMLQQVPGGAVPGVPQLGLIGVPRFR